MKMSMLNSRSNTIYSKLKSIYVKLTMFLLKIYSNEHTLIWFDSIMIFEYSQFQTQKQKRVKFIYKSSFFKTKKIASIWQIKRDESEGSFSTWFKIAVSNQLARGQCSITYIFLCHLIVRQIHDDFKLQNFIGYNSIF